MPYPYLPHYQKSLSVSLPPLLVANAFLSPLESLVIVAAEPPSAPFWLVPRVAVVYGHLAALPATPVYALSELVPELAAVPVLPGPVPAVSSAQ